ncbi:MAG: hypothetical protein ACRC5M_06720 [Anaeroplasmataceae bacterium]
MMSTVYLSILGCLVVLFVIMSLVITMIKETYCDKHEKLIKKLVFINSVIIVLAIVTVILLFILLLTECSKI